MAKPQFEFLDVNKIGWTLVSAERVCLFARYFAEMIIGEGSLHDLTLNQSFSKGSYISVWH
jgi:hypothetical protein